MKKTILLLSIVILYPLVAQSKTLDESRIAEINQITNQSNILQLQSYMQAGKLSAEELTRFYLHQIKTDNPKLKAIIAVNPKALSLAKSLDQERASGKVRGLLHGIPVVVKDNIETKTMPTTAGSLALKNNHTHRDATLVRNLKKSGAIILAKTNLSEWANFRSERSSSGWSGMGGQTRNPLDLNRSPCGSSSGSAAAVAGNLAVAAVGTETDGSITCPSAATGIVGIKPTLGLVSRYGVVPLAHSQDTAGPMTKSVTDAAIMLAAMQGEDKNDSATTSSKFNHKDNYTDSDLNKNQSLKGLRIGLLESRVKPHEGVEAVYAQAIEKLKQSGAVLVPDLKTTKHDGFREDSYSVLLYEFKHDINQYLAALPNKLNHLTLEKLIEFNRDHADQEMPYFKQEIFVKAQEKGSLNDPEYLAALKRVKKTTKEELERLVAENNLDIIISPTLGPAWSIDQINGGKYTGGYSSFSAISGYPYLTLPMGKVHHLPIGLSVIGLSKEDGKVIQVAQAIEKVLKN